MMSLEMNWPLICVLHKKKISEDILQMPSSLSLKSEVSVGFRSTGKNQETEISRRKLIYMRSERADS